MDRNSSVADIELTEPVSFAQPRQRIAASSVATTKSADPTNSLRFDQLLTFDMLSAVNPLLSKKPLFPRGVEQAPWRKDQIVIVPRSFFARIYVLFSDPKESRISSMIVGLVMLLIIISSITFILETMPELNDYSTLCSRCAPVDGESVSAMADRAADAEFCRVNDCEPSPSAILRYLEAISVGVFTVEYVVRLLTSPSRLSSRELVRSIQQRGDTPWEFDSWQGIRRLWFHVRDPMNIIDLVAIVPFYIELAGLSTGAKLTVVRVLRLFRLFRFFKFGTFSEGMLMFMKVFQMSGMGFAILIVFTLFGMIIFASLVFYAEHGEWNPSTGRYERDPLYYLDDKEETPFTSIPRAFWWVLVTFTTVGYGDMSPTTKAGQALAVVAMYVGILFIAMPITIIGANFTELYNNLQERQAELKRQTKERNARIEAYFLRNSQVGLKEAFSLWRKRALRKSKKTEDLPTMIAQVVRQELQRSGVGGGNAGPYPLTDMREMVQAEVRAALVELVLPLLKKESKRF